MQEPTGRGRISGQALEEIAHRSRRGRPQLETVGQCSSRKKMLKQEDGPSTMRWKGRSPRQRRTSRPRPNDKKMSCLSQQQDTPKGSCDSSSQAGWPTQISEQPGRACFRRYWHPAPSAKGSDMPTRGARRAISTLLHQSTTTNALDVAILYP